jgi:hypothetical protein
MLVSHRHTVNSRPIYNVRVPVRGCLLLALKEVCTQRLYFFIFERALDNHRLWAVVIVIKSTCNRTANKSNQPIQNPLLLVTEPRTRDNMFITLSYSITRHKDAWGSGDWVPHILNMNTWMAMRPSYRYKQNRKNFNFVHFQVFRYDTGIQTILSWMVESISRIQSWIRYLYPPTQSWIICDLLDHDIAILVLRHHNPSSSAIIRSEKSPVC